MIRCACDQSPEIGNERASGNEATQHHHVWKSAKYMDGKGFIKGSVALLGVTKQAVWYSI